MSKRPSQFARVRHREFRWAGVWEALLGALAWTVFLIVISFLAACAGIDILEVFKRVTGRS
jgi:hypothetical protein